MQHHPAARATADDAPRRGRRRRRGRIGDRECHVSSRSGGSLIRHAAAHAIRALVVAMIQAAFRARLVARPRGRHTPSAPRASTHVRAVGMAAVTGRTNRKELETRAAGLLAERCVHGAARDDRRCHWTPVPIRGTTEGDYLVPWSSRWSRGPGGSVRAPTLLTVGSAYLRRSRTSTHATSPSSGGRASCQRGAPRPLRGHGACPSKPPERQLLLVPEADDWVEKSPDSCGSTRSPTGFEAASRARPSQVGPGAAARVFVFHPLAFVVAAPERPIEAYIAPVIGECRPPIQPSLSSGHRASAR